LHGASGAPRPPMECPQRHRANIHRLLIWHVTELYGAKWRWRRRGCCDACVFSADRLEVQSAPTPPVSAPGGLARRFSGNATANGMPAASSRDQSPPNNVARHRTSRRATASASDARGGRGRGMSCKYEGVSEGINPFPWIVESSVSPHLALTKQISLFRGSHRPTRRHSDLVAILDSTDPQTRGDKPEMSGRH